MSYQFTVIAGNLGKDPEMRYTKTGEAVTSLNVAVNGSKSDGQGGYTNTTTWFRVSVWGKQAEACNQYLHKGSKVIVEGILQADDKGNPRTFTRNDGSVGASFELTASKVRFLDSRSDGQSSAPASGPAVTSGGTEVEDEIPF